MTIRLQEVVRSEVEGGLTGPANPIPSQSIDCGCGQLPCPKLARFATRRLFVGLLSWIGFVQAASYAYILIAGPTIARRFQFDPYIMNWIVIISELTPILLGLVVAYWGDRIHRATWIGGLVLIQSASHFFLIIPHLTHRVRVIEETENVTHMSLYAEDSPELCSTGSSRIVMQEDEPCYFTLGIFIAVQVISGMANIAYYALGISYLDDNTKKRNVASFIGVILSVKVMGVLLGYILAWGCLRIDAETLVPVRSYREQIGAWWLGFPILTILLIIPGLLLSWFPRMLPSEVVEKAAASLLNNSDRNNRFLRRLSSQKVGSPDYWPSLGRMFTNIVLLCNVISFIFCVTALVNFMNYENLILESRFHVPRPTGLFLGFGDPMASRIISGLLKPILIGLIIIIAGLVIGKAKPSARWITVYNIVAVLLAAGIVYSLIFASCNKPAVVGTDNKGSIFLLKYCNKNCGCSADAEFRPVCDSKGKFTFYSPCHAGCTSSDFKNNIGTYSGCSCVEEMTGKGNLEAKDGPCNSNACQASWLFFEFGTMVAYCLVASTFVGDLLISLRSVNVQDKAISIGFWLTCSAIVVHVPGKILYETIANLTCQYWGNRKSSCHLHDSSKLGNYLCYVTGSLLVLSALFKLLLWFFCKNLKVYGKPEDETRAGTEMQDLIRKPTSTSRQQIDQPNENYNVQAEEEGAVSRAPSSSSVAIVNVQREDEARQQQEAPLKYGPLGPGNRRSNENFMAEEPLTTRKNRVRNLDSEDDLSSSEDEVRKDSSPKVAYRPLDLDSDVESDLSGVQPRSRKRILSRDYDNTSNTGTNDNSIRSNTKSPYRKRDFPNPDDYEDPRSSRSPGFNGHNGFLDGSSKTNSFEFSKKHGENVPVKKGDFNEVGIPIIDPPGRSADSPFLKDVKSLINRYEQNASQEIYDGDAISVRSEGGRSQTESKIVSGIPLVAMVPKRPSAQGQSTLDSTTDGQDNGLDSRSESRGSNNSPKNPKGSKGSLSTDL